MNAVIDDKEQTIQFTFVKREVRNMYQIYSLLTIVALLWGIAIWASIPEEQADRRN